MGKSPKPVGTKPTRVPTKKRSGLDRSQVALGLFAVLVAVAVALFFYDPKGPLSSAEMRKIRVDDLVKRVQGSGWTPRASSFFSGWTMQDVIFGLRGVKLTDSALVNMAGAIESCSQAQMEGAPLPAVYDARGEHAKCFASGFIVDAKNCSSSYAVAAARTLGLRFCIANPSEDVVLLSAQQILSCDKGSKGCKGGSVDGVWKYIEERGLYPEDCVPYLGSKGKCAVADAAKCTEEKKFFALSHCRETSAKTLKREIINRGPVVAPVLLATPFLVYGGGVFPAEDAAGEPHEFVRDDGGHALHAAVTVLGWGKSEESKKEYWIIANSWGETWGENGYARIETSLVRTDMALIATPRTAEAAEAHRRDQEKRAAAAAAEKAEREAAKARVAAKRAERAAAAALKSEQDTDEEAEERVNTDFSGDEDDDDVEMGFEED
jgi:cathepsin B